MERLLVIAALAFADLAAGQHLRVVSYNVAKVSGCESLQPVFAALNDDDKPGFAAAPHLYVFQEVNRDDVMKLCCLLNHKRSAWA